MYYIMRSASVRDIDCSARVRPLRRRLHFAFKHEHEEAARRHVGVCKRPAAAAAPAPPVPKRGATDSKDGPAAPASASNTRRKATATSTSASESASCGSTPADPPPGKGNRAQSRRAAPTALKDERGGSQPAALPRKQRKLAPSSHASKTRKRVSRSDAAQGAERAEASSGVKIEGDEVDDASADAFGYFELASTEPVPDQVEAAAPQTPAGPDEWFELIPKLRELQPEPVRAPQRGVVSNLALKFLEGIDLEDDSFQSQGAADNEFLYKGEFTNVRRLVFRGARRRVTACALCLLMFRCSRMVFV